MGKQKGKKGVNASKRTNNNAAAQHGGKSIPGTKHVDPNKGVFDEFDEIEKEVVEILQANGALGSNINEVMRNPQLALPKQKQQGKKGNAPQGGGMCRVPKPGMTKKQLAQLREKDLLASQKKPSETAKQINPSGKPVKHEEKRIDVLEEDDSSTESTSVSESYDSDEEESEVNEVSSEVGTEDFSDIENERQSEYRKGGYHPVQIGELYADRYRVAHKLGWGFFSTVWLVWDYVNERFHAMKVQKSSREFSVAAKEEIELLTAISKAEMHRTPRCVQLNHFFSYRGPNGNHCCMIFDVYGENLLTLLERYDYEGIPLPIVKCISFQILQALDTVHTAGIIHTDLKPENVLLSSPKHSIISLMRRYRPPPSSHHAALEKKDLSMMTKSQRRRYYKKLAKNREREKEGKALESQNTADDDTLEAVNKGEEERESDNDSETDQEWEVERFHHVVLADFGNSCWVDSHHCEEVQTRQYRSPEVILGEPYSTPIDLWSLACMVFELLTGEFLFNPKKGEDYSRDEDHLALISELLGELPESMRAGTGKFVREFYNYKGEFRHISDLCFCDLETLLTEKYYFKPHKAREITEFLLPMLECDPTKRASAAEMMENYRAFFEIDDDDYEPREKSKRRKKHVEGESSGEEDEEVSYTDSSTVEEEEKKAEEE